MKLYIPSEDTFQEVHVIEKDGLFEVKLGNASYVIEANKIGERHYAMIVNHHPHVVDVVQLGEEVIFRIGSTETAVKVLNEREKMALEMFGGDESAHLAGEVRAPMPGLILKLMVEPGDKVKVGQTLLIMEAMKMENEIRSPVEGTVKQIAVTEQKPVEKDELLIIVE